MQGGLRAGLAKHKASVVGGGEGQLNRLLRTGWADKGGGFTSQRGTLVHLKFLCGRPN